MAPDTSAPSVKASGVSTARVPRTGTPLGAKSSGSITSSPIPPRLTPRPRRYGLPPDRESNSSLSDNDQPDSEAETERLHISPQKVRPKMLVQHSGSSSTTTVAADASPNRQVIVPNNVLEDTPRSPTPRGAAKKRKREENGSPIVRPASEDLDDKPISGLPPKKKVHASSHTPEPVTAVGESLMNPDGGEDDNNTAANAIDTLPTTTADKDQQSVGERPLHPLPSTPNGDAEEEHVEEVPRAIVDEEGGEGQHEDEDEAERARCKKQAMEDLAEIERIFAKLKDSIYDEKMRKVKFELKLLEEGTHPEFVAQKQCIDERLAEKRRLADAQYAHAMQSLDTATRVSKAQIHSQYYQRARQTREDSLYACSELWYHIQRERRAGDSLVPEYTFRIPDRKSTRIKQRMQYNWEVQILGAIQKHVGFPAAPEVGGATDEEMAEDFEALGIVPRPPAASAASSAIARGEDGPDRASPFHWPAAQPSPDSPSTHPATPHPHVHRHILHHHRPHSSVAAPRQPASDPSPAASRRVPGMTGFSSQPANVSLSSILQQSESGPVKMEGFNPQGSFSGYRASESFSAFQSGQRQSSALNHHMYTRPNNSQALSDGRLHGKEPELGAFGRSGDGAGVSDGPQNMLHPPVSLRPVGRGYS